VTRLGLGDAKKWETCKFIFAVIQPAWVTTRCMRSHSAQGVRRVQCDHVGDSFVMYRIQRTKIDSGGGDAFPGFLRTRVGQSVKLREEDTSDELSTAIQWLEEISASEVSDGAECLARNLHGLRSVVYLREHAEEDLLANRKSYSMPTNVPDIVHEDDAFSSTRRRVQSMGDGGMKLDLSCVLGFGEGPSLPDRQKVSQALSVCTKIRNYLFVSGSRATMDKECLLQLGISHIVNLSGEGNFHENESSFRYHNFPLLDDVDEDILCVIYDVASIIATAKSENKACLIHCQQGISRSVSVCAAYLIMYETVHFDDALAQIRRARPIADPNPGFVHRLRELHRWQSAGMYEPRLYRISCLERQRLHEYLIPKEVPVLRESLWTETTSILETSEAIFVWYGKRSGSACRERGREISSLIQQHREIISRRPGPPIQNVREDEEPRVFLRYFSSDEL